MGRVDSMVNVSKPITLKKWSDVSICFSLFGRRISARNKLPRLKNRIEIGI